MEEGTSRSRLDFDAPERFTRFADELGLSAFGMNLIVLRPKGRTKLHRHREQEEVYVVLDGTLTLLVEGEPHVLERHEVIRVAPPLRRQLTNPGEQTVVVLAVGAAGAHERHDGEAFADWDATEGRPAMQVPTQEDLQ